MVTFSTPGPDCYADGTAVADGEWYALCWAKDGSFDGLTTDCRAIGTNEEVILAAPLAEGGRCPLTAFEFARDSKDSAKYDAGVFSLFLLDTRKDGKTPSASVNGRPAFVRELSVATVAEKGSAMSLDTAAASAVGAAGSVAWAQPELQSDRQAEIDRNLVKISAFEILDANVRLTVETEASVLVVKSGATLDTMSSYTLAPSAQAQDGKTTFIIPKSHANFFAVGGLK